MKRYILAFLIIGMLLIGACTEHSSAPQGNYVAPIIPEVYETAKFCDDTLELCNPRDGKRVFEYEIVEEGTKIKLTNVETGETVTHPFKYKVFTGRLGDKREIVIINQFIYYPE